MQRNEPAAAGPGRQPGPSLDRTERAARNQSLFRDVNERISDVSAGFATTTGVLQLVCECADTSCRDQVELRADVYEAVRRHPARFVVDRDHVFPHVERLIEASDGFAIVEKVEPGAKIARATDPRTR